jgi:hypothetical protein
MLRHGADAVESLEEFWREVAQGYDIEPREFFEAEATQQGWSSPVAMALHHIWKRDPKVAAKDAEISALKSVVQGTASAALPYLVASEDAQRLRAALYAVHAKVRELREWFILCGYDWHKRSEVIGKLNALGLTGEEPQ